MLNVDKNLCIGCQMCAITAPNSFKMVSTENGDKSEAINPPGDTEEKIQEAIDNCPVQAIKKI